MSLIRATQLIALVLVLHGCVSTPPDPANMILGTWRSTVGGFSVLTTYTATEVAIEGHQALIYAIDGDQLTIDGDRTTSRRISFPSKNEMLQVDVITGTEHRYSRAETAG